MKSAIQKQTALCCAVRQPVNAPGLTCQLVCVLPSLLSSDCLTANIVKSHRETCQYRVEELQALRWKVFSREEVLAYQSKSVEEMWQRCAYRLTDSIQYVVEFAKRIDGFLELSQNDQIVLLKGGSLEVVLVRMCRSFNPDNGTVFFEGKYGGTEVFKSLGCNDLIAAIFEFSQSLCALHLSEQEVALFTAVVLLNPERAWLQDKEKVARLHSHVDVAFKNTLQRSHRDTVLSKLSQKTLQLKSLCSLHIDRLRSFLELRPCSLTRCSPPLYHELFSDGPDTPWSDREGGRGAPTATEPRASPAAERRG
ncbi:nuclear receptor ROR-gamma-like [Acipenser ruthenus]|uniref:nuclear receptor ROR-gamma-like n=1 Tax=Acipenser ruthenus TaxID=7906 RepID=UPI002742114A|nr:nuclear receptor ROR-gamma-like [Acipenser ruthenus]